jgi:hypothetical protein
MPVPEKEKSVELIKSYMSVSKQEAMPLTG